MTPALLLAISGLILVNLWTMLRFWQDKKRAKAGGRRIPEADLLGLALIGGSPGAFLARHLFRHKTRKEPFSTLLLLIVVLQCGAIIGLDFERDDLVQALGLSFTVSTVALAAGLLWHDAAPVENLLISSLAVVPALIGMAVGQAIRTRISPQLFRRLFLLFLLLLGLEMATHGLQQW